MNPSLLAPRMASLLVPFTFLACVHAGPSSNDTPTTRSRAAGAFTRIDVRGSVDVIVHEGRPLALSVTTKGIAPEKVKTHVEGETLVVDLHDFDRLCFGTCDTSARLDIDAPVLDGVTIGGSGDVTVVGSGAHSRVDLDVSGSGDVRYAGSADLVACNVSGSGDVTLTGAAKRLRADVTGSGDVDARALAVGGGEFVLEGSGDVAADLHGGETTIRLNGSGDLRYTGETRITTLEITGSGDVTHL